MRRLSLGFLALVSLTACAGNRYEYSRSAFNGRLQCAPYARSKTGLALYGPAASWWRGASGKYRRGHMPEAGEVLVFRSSGRLPSGHVSIVRRQVAAREILVEHANWEPGRIDRNVPVVDVSPANDWTLVRVYWAPIHTIGRRAYPTYGFIAPRGLDDIARLQDAPDRAM
ncbi:CHAP domain-containing protein [Kozakia baliensis]|uniref:CHAP domain-containing protein n=1 Tax=Kozakia baliensis TaxID=153496 RepID=UPI000497C5E3|nr:CHAP domain-containing protein [Kozakia baliensis]